MITVLAGLIGAIGIILFFLGFDLARRKKPKTQLDASQLWQQSLAGGGATIDEMELALPFEERIINPLLIRFRGYFQRTTPEAQRNSLEHQLEQAGRPGGLSAADFTAVRYMLAVGLVALLLLVTLPTGNPIIVLLLTAIGGALGFFGPQLWLRQAAGRRRREIQHALPDALDLMVISVEAGLSLDGAIAQVGAKMKGKNPLGDEFTRVITETNLGDSRQDAMNGLAQRTGLEEMNNLVQAIVQSQQMGVPIARMLRIHSESLRTRRRQRASEMAAQATLKMMLPMIGCIFPTIWLVLVGPAVLILLAAQHV